jgi:Tripartite tricarboxylate transporter TctB family
MNGPAMPDSGVAGPSTPVHSITAIRKGASMTKVNREVMAALLLLVFSGIVFWQTYYIPVFESAAMDANLWPRVIVIALAVLCIVHLVQSLRRPAPAPLAEGWRELVDQHWNAFWCFLFFVVFLLLLNVLGMLAGAGLFVFLTLTFLGYRTLRDCVTHLAIAALSVGVIWVAFSYGLNVFLPQGTIFRGW